MGMKSSGGGEIVQVQGGHIVRSTGRKDRHSKVFTAKGPRDRRVRLSAHTAIQFYDVQDRLGYDRPSKAVDWLIKKAKTAISKLAELPPWNPTPPDANAGLEADHDNDMSIPEQVDARGYSFQVQSQQLVDTPSNNNSAFVAPSMDPDTLKSLFPTSSSASFQSYPVEDLGLSLHPLQDQSLVHGHSQGNTSHSSCNEQTLFSATAAPAGFEPGSFQRMVGWGNDAGAENRVSAGFAFSPAQYHHHQQHQQQAMMLGHGPAFSQRGTLQSSFMQSVRAWNDLSVASGDHSRAQELHQSLIVGSRFAPEGLSGFAIPSPIHRDEEQSVVSDQPSSSSPVSQQ